VNIGIDQEKYQSDRQSHQGCKQDQIAQILEFEKFDPEVVASLNRIMTFGQPTHIFVLLFNWLFGH